MVMELAVGFAALYPMAIELSAVAWADSPMATVELDDAVAICPIAIEPREALEPLATVYLPRATPLFLDDAADPIAIALLSVAPPDPARELSPSAMVALPLARASGPIAT